MTTSDREAVAAAVEAVAACVQQHYVDEAGARAAAALRRRLAAGNYDSRPYASDLAPVLTNDLQAPLPDLHLQVQWSQEPLEELADAEADLDEQLGRR